jgi:SAM-dependent methyltransferase
MDSHQTTAEQIVEPHSSAIAGRQSILCRACNASLADAFLDLGVSPLANSYVKAAALHLPESFYPLKVHVCPSCLLVQVEEMASPAEIFSDYAYFSSYSDSWLEHARTYVEMAANRFRLSAASRVVEIASNDGYLLQYFVARGIPALGIEPAANVAEAAKRKGIPTLVKFFGAATARELLAEGHAADLVVGNNVLAHVPALNDFVEGLGILLKPAGVATLEFPHLLRLFEGNQFDTIYHEHFSYFSLLSVERVFAAHGLAICDVEELPTHGGSLRIYARHVDSPEGKVSARVFDLKRREEEAGLNRLETYGRFAERVKETKRKLLEFLIAAKREGKSVAGYGAPAKGNTLLNYCGIRTDFLDYTVDRSPEKQGCFLPGTRIPIHPVERIRETRPDYLLILPWNLREEIMRQMSSIRDWGGRFVVPIPEVRVYP